MRLCNVIQHVGSSLRNRSKIIPVQLGTGLRRRGFNFSFISYLKNLPLPLSLLFISFSILAPHCPPCLITKLNSCPFVCLFGVAYPSLKPHFTDFLLSLVQRESNYVLEEYKNNVIYMPDIGHRAMDTMMTSSVTFHRLPALTEQKINPEDRSSHAEDLLSKA